MAKSTRTPEIEQHLKLHHTYKTTQELADDIGRSRRTVSTWLKELSLKPKAGDKGAPQRHTFSQEEQEFLKDNWFESMDLLAEKLGVNPITVKRHLSMMGFQRPKGKIENMRLRARVYRERNKESAREEWNELPLTRYDAKKSGSTRFWDGQKCEAAGHISPRKTSSGGCWECERLASIEKYKNSPEERERQKEYNRQYNKKNQDRVRKSRREWYESGGRETIREWRRNELETNPAFKIAKTLRDRLNKAVRDQETRKNKSAIKMLGCEIDELMSHLEAQFTSEMSWENYGADTWHIDHIRPCVSFDLTVKEQQMVCFNWRNLQPLSRFDNISKLHSYTSSDEASWAKRMRELGFEGELFLAYETSK